MDNKKKKYHLPIGYSLVQTTLKSTEFLNNPIKFISKSMDAFSGTYSAALGIKRKIILTQNPDFINYILKENHRNYNKSELATDRAAKFLGKGLLFSNGDDWLRQRRLIQPAFHREKLQGLYNIIIKSIDNYLLKFPNGKGVDIYPLVHQLSFNILIQSLFDIKLPPQIMEELSKIFTELQDFLIKDINQPLSRFFYPFTGIEKAKLIKAKRLREIFVAIITERKGSNKQCDDLLDMLLKSKYEDTGEAMTNEQIIDEVLILIFAGHETTANTLSWLLYLLSTSEETIQKLTDSFNGSTIHNCLNNDYLKATINETMRLYPAAWMTERVAIEDDAFAGLSFPKNTIIIPFFFGLHREKIFGMKHSNLTLKDLLLIQKLQNQKITFPLVRGQECVLVIILQWLKCHFLSFHFYKNFKLSQQGKYQK